jgi:enamine deaminase RidA (YjgF/YER057c/UK114 family)
MSEVAAVAAAADAVHLPLRPARLPVADGCRSGAPLGALGWLAYGLPLAAGGLGLPPLAGADARLDVWRGHGVFGRIDIEEADCGGDLAEAARRAYGQVFHTLREHAGGRALHLLRLWNYVPRINAEQDGLERYRRFNIGRQQAFIEAGHDAFEGAPAACALGRAAGPLSVCFLAGATRPLALENPRQVPAYRYGTQHGPRSPTFSRAALVDVGGGDVALLISGTASIVGQDSLHPGDVRAQVRETLANLQAVLAAARARCGAAFDLAALDCTVYVRHAEDLAAVQDEFAAGGGPAAGALYLQADVCRRELLVEIEAHAVAPGGLS